MNMIQLLPDTAQQWQRLTLDIVQNAVGKRIRYKSRGVTHESTIVRVAASGKSIAITGDGDLNNCLNIRRKIQVLM
jgi:hypothetical protein